MTNIISKYIISSLNLNIHYSIFTEKHNFSIYRVRLVVLKKLYYIIINVKIEKLIYYSY